MRKKLDTEYGKAELLLIGLEEILKHREACIELNNLIRQYTGETHYYQEHMIDAIRRLKELNAWQEMVDSAASDLEQMRNIPGHSILSTDKTLLAKMLESERNKKPPYYLYGTWEPEKE